MPAQERSILIDGRPDGGDQLRRQHREAMARNTSPQGPNPRAGADFSQWEDDAAWDEQDEAAGNRARQLLARSNNNLHRFTDFCSGMQRWLHGERWIRRIGLVLVVLVVAKLVWDTGEV